MISYSYCFHISLPPELLGLLSNLLSSLRGELSDEVLE